ncbi:hypothetical protein [Desulfovibrio falkowii]|uniref:Helix-turn-helix domain-containing protein n=1 Tax=Desulfovibrio falkowii TaxID=3136602 RepID=A0ABQ0E5T2_9BACT
MDILVPKNVFLRVEDKFVPQFIENDQDTPSSPTLLYRKLFHASYKTGKCTLPQSQLAAQCKFSVRTLQYAQKRLIELEYIRVEHHPGGYNTYVLLLSDRVKRLLAGIDLIDRSDWYERPEEPVQPTAPSASEADRTPPQSLQGGCANSADSSYKEDKKDKNSSPLSPLPETPAISQTVTPPDAHQGRGDSFPVSSKNYAAMLQAFERLWAVWPVKQDRHRSLRVFCSLARSGRLPSLAVLLAAIQNMSANDDRWRRGYLPNLVNWLQGQRWNDEPIRRSSAHAEPAAPSARPDANKERKVFPPFPASAPLPELSPAMESTVQNLCSIWPAPSHTPVRAFFRALQARKNTLDTSALLAAARAHLAEAGAASGSLLRWLMSRQWEEQRNRAA